MTWCEHAAPAFADRPELREFKVDPARAAGVAALAHERPRCGCRPSTRLRATQTIPLIGREQSDPIIDRLHQLGFDGHRHLTRLRDDHCFPYDKGLYLVSLRNKTA